MPDNDDILDFQNDLEKDRIRELVDQVGEFFDRFGFRRNLGRIWMTLYLAPRPLSQAELIRLTGLSSGLVSSSLRELEHWGAVRVRPRRGSRASTYDAEERLTRVVSTILAKRELHAVLRLRETTRAVRLSPAARQQKRRFRRRLRAIELMTELYEVLASLITRIATLPNTSLAQTIKAIKAARILAQLGSHEDRSSDQEPL